MNDSPWLAIRVPLSPRRALIAKVCAFLFPLAVWTVLCLLWLPDVIILDQGDGEYKPGDRVHRAAFEAGNARIKEEMLAAAASLRITDKSFQTLRSQGVPDTVINNLEGIKGSMTDRASLSFKNREDLEKALKYSLQKEEFDKYKGQILNSAEDEQKALMKGAPSTPDWLPTPLTVAKAFYRAFVTPPRNIGDSWLHESLLHSCYVIFVGFILSAIVGVPLGILCGTFDLVSKLTEPFVDFIRYMPAPAFGVLCVAILGLYDGPKIAIIWIGTFFQMVLVVANTTRQFDESLLEAAQTLGVTHRSLLTKVILPGILPALYNDMRILLGWAWTYLIVAEVNGAFSGISLFLVQQGRYRHFENVYAGIIMIGIIGLVCDQTLAAISRVLFPWMPRSRGGGAWAAFFVAIARLPRLLKGRVSPVAEAAPKSEAVRF